MGDEMKKTIGFMLAAFLVGAAFVGALSFNVSAQAELPVWQEGDGWWFGNTADFSELQAEIDAGMAELPPGFTADINVAGGIGVSLGVEVVNTSYDYNGNICYKVDVTGGLGVDFGLEASVVGEMTEDLLSIEIDGDASLIIVGEANLDGSLFFTVDELAFAGGDITLTADATADLIVDAYVKLFMDTSGFGGEVISEEATIAADASVVIDNAMITGSLDIDPPIDFLQFPIIVYDEWEVPGVDTDWTASMSGSGTVTADIDVTGIPNTPDMHEHQVINLATEIGSHSGTGMIDGFWDSVRLRCVESYGNNYIIETEAGNFFNYFDFPGVRQYGIDPMDLVGDVVPSSAGVEYNADDGFITGVTVDGDVKTSPMSKTEVESFSESPLEDVQQDTGGHGSVGEAGGGIFLLLMIVVIVIIVAFVLVAVMAGRRKKKGPEEMYGAPQQPPVYQQPPPPPPQQ
jgi:hypothetical protein